MATERFYHNRGTVKDPAGCLLTIKIEMVTLALDPLNGTSVTIKVLRKWRDRGIEEVMMKTGLTSAQSLCEFLLQKARRLHQNWCHKPVFAVMEYDSSSQIIPHCTISPRFIDELFISVQYLKIIPISIKIHIR